MKTLVTERLILRPWREEDYLDLYEYAKNPLVGPSAGWQPHKTPEHSRQMIKQYHNTRGECDTRAIVLRSEGRAIGSIGLHKRSPVAPKGDLQEREIGYVLNPKYWGQGIMPEAVRAVLRHAFLDQNVDVIWCGHYGFNENSKRVIEKCGFEFRFGRDEIRYQVDGRRVWSLFYNLEREAYLEQQGFHNHKITAFLPKFQIEGV